MSDQVSFAHVLQFTTNVKHRLQQEGSKVRGLVSTGSHVGNGAVPVEQIGAVTAQERTTRHGDTPILDTPHSRRWVFPRDFEWGDMVDKQDLIRMLIDPKSPYTTAGVNALGRQIDDLLIAAAIGTSQVGTPAGGGATTPETFDLTNFRVAVGATGLTVAKLRTVWEKFANTNMDMDREEFYILIGPQQANNLFNETQVVSFDFNNNKPLPNAKLTPFMGFNFIVTTRLPTQVATIRNAIAFTRSGLYLGLWNDIEVKADQRADKGFNWQLYSRMTVGATRLEQGRVIQIDCQEV